MMGCEDRLKDLALYAGGDLDEEAAGVLEAHLAGCPGCRGELEALKNTLRLAAGFAPEAPPLPEFLSGVRAVRARTVRRRRLAAAAAAAVVLLVLLAGAFMWRWGEAPPGARVAGPGPVEVERVGYSEAVVTILPTQSKSMTVVWIVSDEVVSQEN